MLKPPMGNEVASPASRPTRGGAVIKVQASRRFRVLSATKQCPRGAKASRLSLSFLWGSLCQCRPVPPTPPVEQALGRTRHRVDVPCVLDMRAA